MVDQVTRALTPAQIAAIEAKDNARAAVKPATPGPIVEFVPTEGKQFTISVPLDFPVLVDGTQVEEIVIRRPRMREWRAYVRACVDAIKDKGPGADDLVDQPWISLPAVVIEELDFVDATRLEAAQDGFFGRSTLPQEMEEETSESTSEAGDNSPSQ